MTLASTLSLYVARSFLASVLAMIAALSGLVCLFDFIELLRRASSRADATFQVVTQIALLRVPWIAVEILPFAVLLGGILAFWRLTRTSELVVARAAGVSAWQFLAAPVICAVLLGVGATAVLSPVSAVFRARAEALDASYLRGSGGQATLFGRSLWLRQSDRELTPHGVAILHADGVTQHGGSLDVGAVSVFRLGGDDTLLQRVDAVSGRLMLDADGSGAWLLRQARRVAPGRLPGPPGDVRIATDLTVERVQQSFAPPDTLSVWALPDFIALLDRSGFSSIRHRLHFQSLLALPLLAGTMCMLAASFSMRPARRGGVARMLGSGVAIGFMLFLVTKVAAEFGLSGALPPVLAAWAPAASGLLLAVSLLLHLEDG